jgi:predicted acylesterase/phospholipase RssA/ABC-type phosphate/phosphonate transport system substrate-binding protein
VILISAARRWLSSGSGIAMKPFITAFRSAESALLSFLVFYSAFGHRSHADEARPENGLRIAVLAIQDANGELLSLEKALEKLCVDAGLKDPLRVARGTYADLWHWLETGAVDLAVVSPALLAKSLELGGTVRWEYLASVRSSSALSQSQSVAVVRDDSPVRTTEDLERLLSSGEGRLYFVDPLSVSGTLAPRIALAGIRNSLAESRIRYTHSHTNSLRALRADSATDAVSFVSNGVLVKHAMSGLRTVGLPGLSKLRIPPDSLIVRAEYRQVDQLRKAVNAAARRQPGTSFVADAAWREANAEIREWLAAAGAPAPERLMRVDLDELGQLLVHYARSQPAPLRLAVVFSGGGAKCSYQVGAIRAIEEKLADLRQQTGDATIDISLVVGTSGGAINALPVAMGMASSPVLYNEMAAVWRSLDQRQIIRPALIVRLNMALWFASIEFLCFSWIGRRRAVESGKSHLGRWLLYVTAGAVQVVLARLPFDPWSTLGPRPSAHRLYLWLTFGAEGAGWILLASGAVGLALRATGAEGRPALVLFRRLIRTAAFAGIIVLPALQAWTILGHEPTLSEGYGIEETLLNGFSRLLSSKRLAEGRRPAQVPRPIDGEAREESLQAMSRQIIGEGMISRDLVLTGSVIGERGVEIAPDLYFWASAGRTSQQPSFGARGVSLARYPQLLLDSLMASGAIYPVFPARTIHDFPRIGENTEIVDGSFAHRSPVEAAVLWGASHIILIQADPDELVPRGSFSANIAAALTHLYEQAQLTDVRTKEQAMVFNLAPRPPHIGLLDFATNLIDASIAKGYREVRGEEGASAAHPPPFRKEVGVPHFLSLNVAPDDAMRSSH